MTRVFALVLLAVLAITGAATRLEAQVRPDSIRRDTIRAAIPIPDRLRDSLRVDSIRQSNSGARAAQPVVIPDSANQRLERVRRDSIANARAGDTVKSPIAHFEMPVQFEATNRLRWNREQILSSNAVNLADLLDRVPGVTTFRSGWLAGVHVAAFHSDFARVRYFLDGVELDAIQPRDDGVLDLTDVPLWTLDELVVERAAGEVRVWMRTWSTDRTTPYTRADIYTGDLNTNGFRALLARRYRNGLALQFGGEQNATQTGRVSSLSTEGIASGAGDGAHQTVNFRLGWSRGLFTVDAVGNASTRDRDPQTARDGFRSLPAFKGSRREAYFRAAYGDSARGLWGQALVNVLRTRIEGIRNSDSTGASPTLDTARADTVAGRTQQLLVVGYRAKRWQVSVLNRIRPIAGTMYHAPAVRGNIGSDRLGVGAYAENNAADSTRRLDTYGRYFPLPWLGVIAAVSNRAPINGAVRSSDMTVRVEGAVRYRRTWISGGVVQADPTRFASPTILGVAPVLFSSEKANGLTGSVRGNIYKDVRLDVGVERWGTTQFTRPTFHSHVELALISNWLRKFPKGQFGIDARLIYERRSSVPFLFGVDTTDASLPDVRLSEPIPLFTGQLQIRIQQAEIFYMYRNLTGSRYEQVPGLTMPPAVQMYGVRWVFFN